MVSENVVTGNVVLWATIKNIVVGHDWGGGMWPQRDTTLGPTGLVLVGMVLVAMTMM